MCSEQICYPNTPASLFYLLFLSSAEISKTRRRSYLQGIFRRPVNICNRCSVTEAITTRCFVFTGCCYSSMWFDYLTGCFPLLNQDHSVSSAFEHTNTRQAYFIHVLPSHRSVTVMCIACTLLITLTQSHCIVRCQNFFNSRTEIAVVRR